jgi:excisionase family DNA binding protein
MTEIKLYTITEVAKMLKVSNPTVYKLFREGRLVFCTIGGHRRVTEEQLADYIARAQGGKLISEKADD